MFRHKKSVKVSYNRQGYIYFVSLMYRELPPRAQQQILDLCIRCGGEHYRALFEFVTTEAGAVAVAMRHYISPETLHRLVRKYYESFPKTL